MAKIGPLNLEVTATADGVSRVKDQVAKDMAAIKKAAASVDTGIGDAAPVGNPTKRQARVRKQVQEAKADAKQVAKAAADTGNTYDLVGDYELKPDTRPKPKPFKAPAQDAVDAANKLSGAGKNLKDFDEQIRQTVANLYKLKADAGKGVDVKLTAGQIDKQISKILNSATVKPEDTRTFMQKVWGFSPGETGSEIIKKITGAELVPESLAENPYVMGASIGLLGAKAVSTVGVVNRNAYERDKQDGRQATFGDGLTNVVESLPVVGGLIKSLKTDLMDTFSSVNQELDIVTKSQETWLQLEEKRKQIKLENAQIERETAKVAFAGLQQFNAIGNRGGVKGRSAGIEAGYDATVFDAGQARDAALEGIKTKQSHYNIQFDKSTREQKNLISNSGDEDIRNTAQAELKRLQQERKAFEGQLKQQTADVNDRYGITVGNARKVADKQKGINEGRIADQDGIDNASESLGKSIRTLGVDDLDSLRKQFAELHPDANAVAMYNAQLDALEEKQKQIQGQQVWKQLKDELEDYGLTAEEVAKKRLAKGGVAPADADAAIEKQKLGARIVQGKELAKTLQEEARYYGLSADEQAKAQLQTGGMSATAAADALYRRNSGQTIANSKSLLDVSGAYGNGKENILSELGKAGADKAYVARVKVALDTQEAGQRWQQFKETIKGLNVQLAIEGAGLDERKRREAEIDAQANKDLEGVTDPKLIAERRAQADELKQKTQQLSDAQKANQYTDAADTKQKYQREVDQIGDLLKKGLISEDTARNRLKNTKGEYDSANLPRNNPDLIDINSGALQRMLLTGQQGVTDSSNPELMEARETNRLLADIKNGNKPKLASF